MMSARKSLLLILAIGVSVSVSSVLARPGAPSYPSEDENVIPDYAYDNEEDNGKSEHVGWKSIPVANPDKLYDEVYLPATVPPGVMETTPATEESETTSASTTVAPVVVPDEAKVAEMVGAVRAVDVAGSAGAAAAVQAVEVVKAAFETTDVPDKTTTTRAVESGRAASSNSGSFFDSERPLGDAPTPTTDQTFYGFSKFLHDLVQVPVLVMRSVSSYLSGAFNSRHDVAGAPITPQDDHGLTSAMLSQSF